MKKSIMFSLIALAICILAGCSSVSNNLNLSGTWNYTFKEFGKDQVQTGSMTIMQDSYKLTGKANDSFGEFQLTGTYIPGSPSLVLDGIRNDKTRTFHFVGKLSSDNEFDGTYTTNQNTSGTLNATRIGGK